MRNEPEPQAGSRLRSLAALFRRFVFQQLANRVLNDVIDDVGGCVINTACFLDLWFVFNFCLMPLGEPDDLPRNCS
jgi:hypothetical protein